MPADAPGSIRLRGVGKVYALGAGRAALRSPTPRRVAAAPERFHAALRDIDLDVSPGESVGIIGPNGAGKTTLLGIVGGVTTPTTGRVVHQGTVTSMIDLGLGFHPEMTGWANLECSARLLGLSGKEVRRLAPAIAEFSGIADALDDPLRTYSTGMSARLGFAIATHVPTDILVIDEVLAVGDREFQIACIERARELVAGGTTLLFVSHEMPLVTQVCDRAIHVRQGSIVDDGPALEVVRRYLEPSSGRMRPDPDPALRFLDCRVERSSIAPLEPLEITAVIEVSSAGVRAELGLDIVLPTLDPDAVRFSTFCPLPAVAEPGIYTLRGVSDEYPSDTGVVQVRVNLVDARAHRLADQRVVEFSVVGSPTEPRHRLKASPAWTITPAEPHTLDRSDEQAHRGRPAIRLDGVTKTYRSRTTRGVGNVRRSGRGRLVALDDCTVELMTGETTGVIGPNGAGKSTMLRLVAGVTTPDSGSIAVHGRVVPVLQLGLGFHPDLSGEENVRISGRLLGLTGEEIQEALPSVVEFAGLGAVLDQPVRTYSSGMVARLAFSLVAHSGADVLLLDEILAVGDEEFRRRAVPRVRQLAKTGCAVVFVSHDLGLIEEVADRVIRFERGVITDDGDPASVIKRFGGRAWAAGNSDASAGIRLHEMDLRRRQIPTGAELAFHGLVEVAEPSTHARVELSLRVPLEDRSRVLDRSEFESRCIFVATVEPSGGALSRPGWYRFEGAIDRTPLVAALDVVLSVVDERDGTVVSEFWQAVSIGRVRPDEMPRMELGFTWEATPGGGSTLAE